MTTEGFELRQERSLSTTTEGLGYLATQLEIVKQFERLGVEVVECDHALIEVVLQNRHDYDDDWVVRNAQLVFRFEDWDAAAKVFELAEPNFQSRFSHSAEQQFIGVLAMDAAAVAKHLSFLAA